MSTTVALSVIFAAAAAITGTNAQSTTSVPPLAEQTYAYGDLVRRAQ